MKITKKQVKKKIDIVTACTGADMTFARYGIFSEAKIYMLRGQSYGGITVNSMTGGLSLTMQVEDSRDVSYKEWLQVYQQRQKGRDNLAVLKK